MRDFLNEYIDSFSDEPLKAIKELPAEELDPLLASALETANISSVWVDEDCVTEVYQRELSTRGEAAALREAVNFISVWQNYKTQASTTHTDLLPDGHPRNNRYRTREDLALYMATQVPEGIDPGVKTSLIKAVQAEYSSVDREYHSAVVASVAPQLSYLIEDADYAIHGDSMYYDDQPLDDSRALFLLESNDIDDEE